MNRNQAKELFRNDKDSYGRVKKVMKKIDKIFDEFESRTCENCKFYKHEEGTQPDGMGWVEEECLNYGNGFAPSMIDNEGCSKWEAK